MMATDEEKLEKIQYLNNSNLSRFEKKFTGSHTTHWKEGEPLKEEENRKKNINLE
jgi:hypothetical protein